MTEQNCKRQMIVITTLTSQRSSSTTFAGDDTQLHQSRNSNHLHKMLSIKPLKSCSIPQWFRDLISDGYTGQNMKFSIKDFFSKCNQIRSFVSIWSYLLKKSLLKNFFFCGVLPVLNVSRANKIANNFNRQTHRKPELKNFWKYIASPVDMRKGYLHHDL